MSKLLERLKKASTIKIADTLEDSTFFNEIDETPTDIPAINIALSGSVTGGLKSGILTLAAPSRHFKSMYGLIIASAYLKKNPEAVLLFYDSEFGSPKEYFISVGIDPNRVLHIPVTDLEELKFDIVQQLKEINRGDKVIFMIDSIGNLASKKEVDDAEEGKSAGDMTRAKFLKGFYRIITPHLRIKDLPLIQVLHTYQTMETYAKTIIGGGQGALLASDNAWIMTRSQEKDGTDLAGYNFNIKIEKSRYVREKSTIPITVKFEGGLSKWTGLLDIAVESKAVIKPSNGWYSRVSDDGVVEDKKFRSKDTENSDFWIPVLKSKIFKNYIELTYKVTNGSLMKDEDIEDDQEDLE